MLATNLATSGSFRFGSVAVTVPALLGASMVTGQFVDMKAMARRVGLGLVPLASRGRWGMVVACVGAFGALGVVAVARETAIFSAAHGANKLAAGITRWFSDQKAFGLMEWGEKARTLGLLKIGLVDIERGRIRYKVPRYRQIEAWKKEREKALVLVRKEYLACSADLGSLSCFMFRDLAWVDDEEELLHLGAKRERAITDFYDPQIAALERDIIRFAR